MRIFVLISVCSALILACSQQNTSPTSAQLAITDQIFADSVTEFKINVIYEIGATPYTGNIGLTTNNTWDITKNSYQALFQNHGGRTITTPTVIGDMVQIADQAKSVWTADELIALGNSNMQVFVSGTKVNTSVIFLNGTYQGNNSILGIHFTGHTFVFIFKDVVTSVGGTSADQRYVEQATVVHEVGHAVGLVNNGLPMVTNHDDSAHLKHSTNNLCVMYWSVESSTTILTSLTHFITGSQLNLFGSESLADGRAYHK